jgi:hypothetical protein
MQINRRYLLLHLVETQNHYNALLHFDYLKLVGLFCRVFRIRHEKLGEGCLYGSTERGSETRHRNNKAEKGGYAPSNFSG